MKIVKVFVLGISSFIMILIIVLFEVKNWPAGSSISGLVLGFSLPAL